MTTLPILYSFRRCPYAMRARLAIAVSKQKVELREILLRDKPQKMLDVSSKGTVPVLVLANRTVIDESLHIMKWALELNDPYGWLNNVGTELVNENDTKFKKFLDMYKYCDRHPEQPQTHYRSEAEVFLQKLEDRLTNTRYLSGDKMRFIDIAILPFVRQFAHVNIEWFESSRYFGVQRWLKEFKESDLFNSIMVKYPKWETESTPITFL